MATKKREPFYDEFDEIINQFIDDAHYDRFDEIDLDVNRLKIFFWKLAAETFLDGTPSPLVLNQLKALKKKLISL
jgi:hypothetical protein